MHSILTVIIPSIGRETLSRSLVSLQNQSNQNWLAYVGFDGCEPPKPIQDCRINYVYLEKTGKVNHAGSVRNALLPLVTTDWLCFLDDDDSFRGNYIDSFIKEITDNPTADCIVFRMSYDKKDLKVLPPLGTTQPRICFVGISFAVKKDFLTKNEIKFSSSSFEDFSFLKQIEEHGGNIVFSKEITYNVRY